MHDLKSPLSALIALIKQARKDTGQVDLQLLEMVGTRMENIVSDLN